MKDKNPYNFPRPAGLEEYILRYVADKAYIIADTKKDTYYCTRCGQVGRLSEDYPYHNHDTKCYCDGCGDAAILRYARYGRKGITETGRILWSRKHGAGTFLQLDEYDIDYTDDRPKVFLWPSAQYYMSKKMQVYYKHAPGSYWYGESWEKRKNIMLPSAPGHCWYGNYYARKYEKTVSHISVHEQVGSDLRYANMDMSRLGCVDPGDPYAIISYIHNFLKYPSIEILEKSGFSGIVQARLARGSRHINWRAADLRGILKLNFDEIRRLRSLKKKGDQLDALEAYKKLKKIAPSTTFENLGLRRQIIGWRDIDVLEKQLKKYMSVEKCLQYLTKQQGNRTFTVSDYLDYLDECRALGMDLKRKSVFMPQDLIAAHENTSSQIKVAEDEKKKIMFRDAVGELYPFETYNYGDYIVRVAETAEELRKESEVLGHCVRTYIDRVCRRSCTILFIRKASDPDTPLFTVELSPKYRIQQCRGLKNCSYPEDVAEFLEHWKKDVLENKKAARKAA